METGSVDDYVADALTYTDESASAGDSIDWRIAVIAYIITVGVTVEGVYVPAGNYVREITGQGRTVLAYTVPTAKDALDIVEKIDALYAAHVAELDMRSQCECESDACTHGAGECDNNAKDARMIYVGPVCDACAQRVANNGGASYVTAPHGTWSGTN